MKGKDMKGRDMERLQEENLKEREILFKSFEKEMNEIIKTWSNKLCEKLLKETKNGKKKNL